MVFLRTQVGVRVFDMSSSPFVTKPLISNQEALAEINKLLYELKALKTEKEILQKNGKSLEARYVHIFRENANKLKAAHDDYDRVAKERDDYKRQIERLKDSPSETSLLQAKEIADLRDERKLLQLTIKKQQTEMDNRSRDLETLIHKVRENYKTMDEYRERLQKAETENASLRKSNDALEREQLANSVKSDSTDKARCEKYRKKYLDLKAKTTELLQQTINAELLKQKNQDLQAKADRLAETEQKLSVLEVEHAELKAKYDEHFGAIEAGTDGSVSDFVSEFRALQHRNTVYFEKLSSVTAQLSQVESERDMQKARLDELVPVAEELQNFNDRLQDEVKELEKVRLLNSKEIEFLRETQRSEETNVYLANLEKLVDEYKRENERLCLEMKPPAVPSPKRQKVEVDDSRAAELVFLRAENLELQAKLKGVMEDLERLRENAKKQDTGARILELRASPFGKDQLVKQAHIDALKKENQALLEGCTNSVPRAVFARQEHDKEVLQAEIDDLHKRNERLKTVFAQKSKQLVLTVSRFFGFTIEFIASPLNPNDLCLKIKLVSRSQADMKNPPYLLIDVQSKLLKANGDYEFKQLCEQLVEHWVDEKRLIPCFLSALNLKIHETVRG